MLRVLVVVVACFGSACASEAPLGPPPRSPAGHPDLALSAVVAVSADPAPVAQRSRRVGRLSPPFAAGAPARNVLARASAEPSDRDLAAR
jgi:hypothetical protein